MDFQVMSQGLEVLEDDRLLEMGMVLIVQPTVVVGS